MLPIQELHLSKPFVPRETDKHHGDQDFLVVHTATLESPPIIKVIPDQHNVIKIITDPNVWIGGDLYYTIKYSKDKKLLDVYSDPDGIAYLPLLIPENTTHAAISIAAKRNKGVGDGSERWYTIQLHIVGVKKKIKA